MDEKFKVDLQDFHIHPAFAQELSVAADLWCVLLPSVCRIEMFDDRDVAFGARPRVSGNSFANGANQNCGNSIADIPSTRVAAPPGGKSSLCLGWDDTPAPVPRGRGRGARAECPPATVPGIPPAPAAGAPSGARAAGARGPGPQGHGPEAYGVRPRESSNSYASGHNQNTGNVLTGVPTTRVSRPPGGHSEFSLAWDTGPAVGRGERAPIPRAGGSQAPDAFGQRLRVSSNSYANGADQNSGNVLSDTPTTRVLRPPGGGSSLNLGWSWGHKFTATALVA